MPHPAFAKFTKISEETQRRLLEFAALLREKNEIVNLISRKDMEDVEYRHVAFCASIAEFFTPDKGARIADVGTGGGLPGIVMAILWPQAQITMFDGVGRKISAVQDMIDALKLKNARALNQRVEEQKQNFDYATGRSVCALPQFFGFVVKRLEEGKRGNLENGVIYFKGGDLEEEFAQKNVAPKHSFDIEKFFGDERFAQKRLLHFPTRDVRIICGK